MNPRSDQPSHRVRTFVHPFIIRQGVSQRLHWIPMDPAQRERVYRRSGEKAIQDYFKAKGVLPYATDAEKPK